MLLESRLYSFIDQTEGFTIHFLEGQKLIHDIALIHKVSGEGFHFFRDTLLATQLLLAYLKPGEGLGIYIDSNEPYFKFKIEMSELGQMRTLLLPDEFKTFPKKITGACRVSKTAPAEKAPYNSIIDLIETPSSEVINKLLEHSYQLKSKVYISEDSDQAIMISKLPEIEINKIQTNYSLSVEEYWNKHQEKINLFLAKFSSDYQLIQNFFEDLGTVMLFVKEVKFKCNCSRERMAHGIYTLIKTTGIDHVFMPDENEIQTKCDYCHEEYSFHRNDFLS